MVARRCERSAAAAAAEEDLPAVPVETITTSGSIRRTRAASRSLTTQASAFPLLTDEAGRESNCRTGSSITSPLTARFLITFTAIVRTGRLIAGQVALVAVVVLAAARFRGARGSAWPGAGGVGQLPIPSTTTTSGHPRRARAAWAELSRSTTSRQARRATSRFGRVTRAATSRRL